MHSVTYLQTMKSALAAYIFFFFSYAKDSARRWNLWFPSAGVFAEVLAGRVTGTQITFPPDPRGGQVGIIGGVLTGFVTGIHKDSVRRCNLWFPSAGVFAEVLAGRATGTQITFPTTTKSH